MKKRLIKNKEWLWVLLVIFGVVMIYLFLYDIPGRNSHDTGILQKILDTFNTEIVSALSVGVGFGVFFHKLESNRLRSERKLFQRVELRNRALECFEEINKIIVKIRFHDAIEDYDHVDIRVDFDQMANFFIELQEIYKNIPGAIPQMEAVDKLSTIYHGWNKYGLNEYFEFKKPKDVESHKKIVSDAEKYLNSLKEALVEFIYTLQLE